MSLLLGAYDVEVHRIYQDDFRLLIRPDPNARVGERSSSSNRSRRQSSGAGLSGPGGHAELQSFAPLQLYRNRDGFVG
jgi:hypothetical protein